MQPCRDTGTERTEQPGWAALINILRYRFVVQYTSPLIPTNQVSGELWRIITPYLEEKLASIWNVNAHDA